LNILHTIHLRDVGPLQNVQFKIPKGLSVIYGLNRSGGKSSRNANWVGKSLMFGAVSDILYDDPIVGQKEDRLRTGNRSLAFINARGQKVLVRKQALGKSEKLTIKVNGEDKDYRTASIAKANLEKLWPITQEEYSTYIHLDSRVPHPLVMGTSAQRKSFFTSFFNLHQLDNERKLYVAELNKLQRVKTAYNELLIQYKKQKENLLSEKDYDNYKQRVVKLQERMKNLQTVFTEVQETLRLIRFAESAQKQIKELNIACNNNISFEEFEEAEKLNAFELKQTIEESRDAEAWDQYRRDNANYEKAYSDLSEDAVNLIEETGYGNALKETDNAYRKYIKYRAQEKQITVQLENLIHDLPALPEKTVAPDEDRGNLETLERVYTHHLKHAEKFKKGICETCGQVVTIKSPALIQKKLKEIRHKLNIYDEAEKYLIAYKKRKEIKTELTLKKQELLNVQKAKKKYLAMAKIHEEIRNLPKEPAPFEGKKLQTEVLKRMLIEIRERKALLEYMKPHLDTVIDFKNLTKKDILKAQSSKDLSEQMNQVQEVFSKIQSKLDVHNAVKNQLNDIRTRLRELKEKLKNEEPLRHLVQGYQDKNIKRMVIQAISHDLMKRVNLYASRIFIENYRFEFRWDNRVSLLVHRKSGNKVITTDVRKLSGAETTLFTLILVCALLAYVPSHKRCSAIILDEPSAHMSEETVDMLKEVIKVLSTLIPSVIVITPKDEDYPNAKNFTVIKENGIATIVEGKPYEQ